MVLKRSLVVTASLVATLSCGGMATFGPLATTAQAAPASASKDASAEQASKSLSYTPAAGEETRTVTDMDGNEVVIPAEVDRVAPVIGAFSQIAAMVDGHGGSQTVADIGRTSQTEMFQKVFAASNPDNYNARSVEDLIASGAQVAFGPGGMFSDEQLTQLEAANIAYVALGTKTVEDISNTAITIGQILGEDEYANAQKFAEYYQGWIEKATETTKDADKPTVMELSISGGNYSTINKSDICQSYFDAAGAVNVAADYTGSNGELTVSAEQILEWNPQYLFVFYTDNVDEVMNDPALAEVDAVKNGNVYVIPAGTYYWSVRSGEGALMTPWLCSVLHPDLFADLDMKTEVQDFYQNFYGYDLSDEDAEAILTGLPSSK